MRVRTGSVALELVVLAVVPYIALKVLWLAGAGIGVPDETVLVGNDLTILLQLAAVVLALALTSGWGRRVAWVFAVVYGSFGLIAIGAPTGSGSPGGARTPRAHVRSRRCTPARPHPPPTRSSP